MLGMTSKAVNDVIALTWQLDKNVEAGVCNETNMFVTESLCKEGAEDGLRGMASMREKVRVPGTLGMISTESMQGRNVDSKAGTVGRDLVKVRDELMTKVLSISNNKGGEACKEGLVVLIRIIVAINELGKEGLAINMQVAKL